MNREGAASSSSWCSMRRCSMRLVRTGRGRPLCRNEGWSIDAESMMMCPRTPRCLRCSALETRARHASTVPSRSLEIRSFYLEALPSAPNICLAPPSICLCTWQGGKLSQLTFRISRWPSDRSNPCGSSHTDCYPQRADNGMD